MGAAIPVSFLFALIFVWALGYTFNFMVAFGMLLGLGMLIDGAIVITEYADRKMAEGPGAEKTAYSASAKRMVLAGDGIRRPPPLRRSCRSCSGPAWLASSCAICR